MLEDVVSENKLLLREIKAAQASLRDNEATIAELRKVGAAVILAASKNASDRDTVRAALAERDATIARLQAELIAINDANIAR